MNQFVTLLRGVNVGKNHRVPMAEWRAAMTALGFESVRTLLNSGNAVFSSSSRSSDKLAAQIARVITETFAVDTPVIVKSAAEFRAIVAENPIPPTESECARFLVIVAQDATRLKELHAFSALQGTGEQFVVGEHAAYLHCANGILESKLADALLSKAGLHLTSRNWSTVSKLWAMLDH